MNIRGGPFLRDAPDRAQQAVPFGLAPEDDDIDIRAITLKIWRRRRLIISFVVVAVAFALMIVSSWQPPYKAAVKVLYSPSDRQVVDLNQVVQDDNSYMALANQLEILKSTSLMERVRGELEASRNREPDAADGAPQTFTPKIGGVIPVPKGIADQLISLGVLSPPPILTPEALEEKRRQDMLDGLLSGVKVALVGDSRVIEISFISTDPEYAAQVVNTVARQYIVDQLEAKLEAATSATVWLTDRVEELRVKVQDAEQAVEAARAALVEETGQGMDVLNNQLSGVTASLAELRNVISDKSARMEQIDRATSAGEFGSVAEFRASKTLTDLRGTESEILDRQLSLSQSVPEDHPVRERLRARLDDVRAKMRDEAQRIAASHRSELRSLQVREAELATDLRELESRILDQSRSELKVRQLEREANASRALYQNFLARLQETSAQMQLKAADARVLSPAEAPKSPLRSQERRVVILAGIGALFLSFGVIWLLEQISNTFRVREELELATGERVLASIPSVGRDLKAWQIIRYFKEKPSSSLAEAVRHLRTSLISARGEDDRKVFMFTSSIPEEGKSTTAMLLALLATRMNKKVIIIDCDLRRPSLAELLSSDYGKVPGLLAVLEGRAELADAIRVEEDSGLHTLITTSDHGSSTLNAADVLTSKRFSDLLQLLREHYDMIIVDSPPVLAVSDPRIIARHADAVVYTVCWDSTPPAAVLEGLNELRGVDAPISGLAFTLVDTKRASAHGHYGSYKYKYGKYYEN